MPPVGFEPTFSPGERPQTYALDRAATGEDLYLMSLNCRYLDAYSRSCQNIDDRFSLHSQIVSHKECHLFQELLLWSQIVPCREHSPYQVWKRKTVTYWIARRPSSKVSIFVPFFRKIDCQFFFFWKSRIQNFVTIRPVGAELSYLERRTIEYSDMMESIFAFRKFYERA